MSSRLDDAVRTLFKSGGIMLGGFVLQLFLSFLAKLFIARELTPGDFGTISLGMTISTLASSFVVLGMTQAIPRFLPRYDTDRERRGVLVTAFSLTLPVAGGLSVLIIVGAPLLARLLSDAPNAVTVFQIFGLVLLLRVIVRLAGSTIQGMKESVPKVLMDIAAPTSRFIAVGAVIVYGVTSVRFALAYFIGVLVPALIGLVYLYRRTTLFRVSRPAQTRYREMLIFSIPLLLSSVMSFVFSDIDKLMIGYLTTAGEVGIYDVVYTMGKLLTTGLMAFNFVFMPIISELHADDRMNEVRSFYLTVTKWIVVITFPVFLVVFLFPEFLISASFGPKYASGSLTLQVLAVGFFIHSIAGLNSNTLVSVGKTRLILVFNTVMALVNVGLNLVLIPEFGLLGAGIATTISYLLLNLLFSGYLFSSYGIVPLGRSVVRPILASSLIVALLYAAIQYVGSQSLFVLMTFGVLFVVLYGITLLRFGALESEEVMLIKSIEERFEVDLTPIKRVGHVFFKEREDE